MYELGSVTAKATGAIYPKRNIVIVDSSEASVEVTLWGTTPKALR